MSLKQQDGSQFTREAIWGKLWRNRQGMQYGGDICQILSSRSEFIVLVAKGFLMLLLFHFHTPWLKGNNQKTFPVPSRRSPLVLQILSITNGFSPIPTTSVSTRVSLTGKTWPHSLLSFTYVCCDKGQRHPAPSNGQTLSLPTPPAWLSSIWNSVFLSVAESLIRLPAKDKEI